MTDQNKVAWFDTPLKDITLCDLSEDGFCQLKRAYDALKVSNQKLEELIFKSSKDLEACGKKNEDLEEQLNHLSNALG